MPRTYRILGGALLTLGIVLTAGTSRGQTPDGAVSVRKLKYADLGKLVRGLKGKVVLVEYWAEF